MFRGKGGGHAMIQIAICDDNIDELCNMTQLIDQYKIIKNLNCQYAAFQNGFDLISALEKGRRFDLYCLDIVMPAITGIETAKEIRSFDKNAPIIFFTSSTEFALQSYSVKAVNYVLKPISKDKLFFTFDEVVEKIKVSEEEGIIVKSSEGIQKIFISNLLFAEVIGRNVLYHLISGKVIQCSDSFASVCERLLKYSCFVKTHRSYIVNMNHIGSIDNNQVILQNSASLIIAQGKGKEIKQKYLDFQMEDE